MVTLSGNTTSTVDDAVVEEKLAADATFSEVKNEEATTTLQAKNCEVEVVEVIASGNNGKVSEVVAELIEKDRNHVSLLLEEANNSKELATCGDDHNVGEGKVKLVEDGKGGSLELVDARSIMKKTVKVARGREDGEDKVGEVEMWDKDGKTLILDALVTKKDEVVSTTTLDGRVGNMEGSQAKDDKDVTKGQYDHELVAQDEKGGSSMAVEALNEKEVATMPNVGKDIKNRALDAKDHEGGVVVGSDDGQLVGEDKKSQSFMGMEAKNDNEALEHDEMGRRFSLWQDKEAANACQQQKDQSSMALKTKNIEEIVDTLQDTEGGTKEPFIDDNEEVVVAKHECYSELGVEVEKCRHSTKEGRNDNDVPPTSRGDKYEDSKALEAKNYEQAIFGGSIDSELVMQDENDGSFEAVEVENDEEVAKVSKDEKCRCLEALETKNAKKTSMASPVNGGCNMNALVAKKDMVVAAKRKDYNDLAVQAKKVGSFQVAKAENDKEVVAVSKGEIDQKLGASNDNDDEGTMIKGQNDGTLMGHDEKVRSFAVVDAKNDNEVFTLLHDGERGDLEVLDTEWMMAKDKYGGDMVRQDEILVLVEARNDSKPAEEAKYEKDQNLEAMGTEKDEETSLRYPYSEGDNAKALVAKDDEVATTEGNVNGELVVQDKKVEIFVVVRASSDENVIAMLEDEKCANLETLNAIDNVSTTIGDEDVMELVEKYEKGGLFVLDEEKSDKEAADACQDAKDQISMTLEIENIKEMVAALQDSEGGTMEPLVDEDNEVVVAERGCYSALGAEVEKCRCSIDDGRNDNDVPPALQGDKFEDSEAYEARDYKRTISDGYDDKELVVHDEKDGGFEGVQAKNNMEAADVPKDEKCQSMEALETKDDEVFALLQSKECGDLEASNAKDDERIVGTENYGGDLVIMHYEIPMALKAENDNEPAEETNYEKNGSFEVVGTSKIDEEISLMSLDNTGDDAKEFVVVDDEAIVNEEYIKGELAVQDEKVGRFATMSANSGKDAATVLQGEKCANLKALNTTNDVSTTIGDEDVKELARKEEKGGYLVPVKDKNDEVASNSCHDEKDQSMMALEIENIREKVITFQYNESGSMESLVENDDEVVVDKHGCYDESIAKVEKCKCPTDDGMNGNDMPLAWQGDKYESFEGYDVKDYERAISEVYDDRELVVEDEKYGVFEVMDAKTYKEAAIDEKYQCLEALETKHDEETIVASPISEGWNVEALVAGEDRVVVTEGRYENELAVQAEKGGSFVVAKVENDVNLVSMFQGATSGNLGAPDANDDKGGTIKGQDDGTSMGHDGKFWSIVVADAKNNSVVIAPLQGGECGDLEASNTKNYEAIAATKKYVGNLVRQDEVLVAMEDENDSEPAKESKYEKDQSFEAIETKHNEGIGLTSLDSTSDNAKAFVVMDDEATSIEGYVKGELAVHDENGGRFAVAWASSDKDVIVALQGEKCANLETLNVIDDVSTSFGDGDVRELTRKDERGQFLVLVEDKNDNDASNSCQDVKDQSLMVLEIENVEEIFNASEYNEYGNVEFLVNEDDELIVAEHGYYSELSAKIEKYRCSIEDGTNDNDIPPALQGNRYEDFEAYDARDYEPIIFESYNGSEVVVQDEKHGGFDVVETKSHKEAAKVPNYEKCQRLEALETKDDEKAMTTLLVREGWNIQDMFAGDNSIVVTEDKYEDKLVAQAKKGGGFAVAKAENDMEVISISQGAIGGKLGASDANDDKRAAVKGQDDGMVGYDEKVGSIVAMDAKNDSVVFAPLQGEEYGELETLDARDDQRIADTEKYGGDLVRQNEILVAVEAGNGSRLIEGAKYVKNQSLESMGTENDEETCLTFANCTGDNTESLVDKVDEATTMEGNIEGELAMQDEKCGRFVAERVSCDEDVIAVLQDEKCAILEALNAMDNVSTSTGDRDVGESIGKDEKGRYFVLVKGKNDKEEANACQDVKDQSLIDLEIESTKEMVAVLHDNECGNIEPLIDTNNEVVLAEHEYYNKSSAEIEKYRRSTYESKHDDDLPLVSQGKKYVDSEASNAQDFKQVISKDYDGKVVVQYEKYGCFHATEVETDEQEAEVSKHETCRCFESSKTKDDEETLVALPISGGWNVEALVAGDDRVVAIEDKDNNNMVLEDDKDGNFVVVKAENDEEVAMESQGAIDEKLGASDSNNDERATVKGQGDGMLVEHDEKVRIFVVMDAKNDNQMFAPSQGRECGDFNALDAKDDEGTADTNRDSGDLVREDEILMEVEARNDSKLAEEAKYVKGQSLEAVGTKNTEEVGLTSPISTGDNVESLVAKNDEAIVTKGNIKGQLVVQDEKGRRFATARANSDEDVTTVLQDEKCANLEGLNAMNDMSTFDGDGDVGELARKDEKGWNFFVPIEDKIDDETANECQDVKDQSLIALEIENIREMVAALQDSEGGNMESFIYTRDKVVVTEQKYYSESCEKVEKYRCSIEVCKNDNDLPPTSQGNKYEDSEALNARDYEQAISRQYDYRESMVQDEKNVGFEAVESKNDEKLAKMFKVEKCPYWQASDTKDDEKTPMTSLVSGGWNMEALVARDGWVVATEDKDGNDMAVKSEIGERSTMVGASSDKNVTAILQDEQCANLEALNATEYANTSVEDRDVLELVGKYEKREYFALIEDKIHEKAENACQDVKDQSSMALEIENIEEMVATLQDIEGENMTPLVDVNDEVVLAKQEYYNESIAEVKKYKSSTGKGRNDDDFPQASQGNKYEESKTLNAMDYEKVISKEYNDRKLVVQDEKDGVFEALEAKNNEVAKISKVQKCQHWEVSNTKDDEGTMETSPICGGWNMEYLVACNDSFVPIEDRDDNNVEAQVMKSGSFGVANAANNEEVVVVSQGATSGRLGVSDANDNEGTSVKGQGDGTLAGHVKEASNSMVPDAKNNNKMFAPLQGRESEDLEASYASDNEGIASIEKDGGDLVRQDEILLTVGAGNDSEHEEAKYVKDQMLEAMGIEKDKETCLTSPDSTSDNVESLVTEDEEAVMTKGNIKDEMVVQDRKCERSMPTRASKDEDVTTVLQDEKCANLEVFNAMVDVSTFVGDGDVGESAGNDEKIGYFLPIQDKMDVEATDACLDLKDQSSMALEIENIEGMVVALQGSEGGDMDSLVDANDEVVVSEQEYYIEFSEEVQKYRLSVGKGMNDNDLPPVSRGDKYEESKALNAQDYEKATSREYDDSKLMVQVQKDGSFEAVEIENDEESAKVSKEEKCPHLKASNTTDYEETAERSLVSGGWNMEGIVSNDDRVIEIADGDDNNMVAQVEKQGSFVVVKDKNDEEVAAMSQGAIAGRLGALNANDDEKAVVKEQDVGTLVGYNEKVGSTAVVDAMNDNKVFAPLREWNCGDMEDLDARDDEGTVGEDKNGNDLVRLDEILMVVEAMTDSELAKEPKYVKDQELEAVGTANDEEIGLTSLDSTSYNGESLAAEDDEVVVTEGNIKSESIVQDEKGRRSTVVRASRDEDVVGMLQDEKCVALDGSNTMDDVSTYVGDRDVWELARKVEKGGYFVPVEDKTNKKAVVDACQDVKDHSSMALEIANVEMVATFQESEGGNMELLVDEDKVILVEHRYYNESGAKVEKCRLFVDEERNDDGFPPVSRSNKYENSKASDDQDYKEAIFRGYNDSKLVVQYGKDGGFEVMEAQNDEESVEVSKDKKCQCLEALETKDDEEIMVISPVKIGWNVEALVARDDEVIATKDRDYNSMATQAKKDESSMVAKVENKEDMDVVSQGVAGGRLGALDDNEDEGAAMVKGQDDGTLLGHDEVVGISVVEDAKNNNEVLALLQGGECTDLEASNAREDEGTTTIEKYGSDLVRQDEILVAVKAENDNELAEEAKYVKDQSLEAVQIKNYRESSLTSLESKGDDAESVVAENNGTVVTKGNINGELAMQDEKGRRSITESASSEENVDAVLQDENFANLESLNATDDVSTSVGDGDVGELARKDKQRGYFVLFEDKIDKDVTNACQVFNNSLSALEIENIKEMIATLQGCEVGNMEPLVDKDDEVVVAKQKYYIEYVEEVEKYRCSINEGKSEDELPLASQGNKYEDSEALNAQDYKQAISKEYDDRELVVQDEKDGSIDVVQTENDDELAEVSKDEKCWCLEPSETKNYEETVATSPVGGGWIVDALVSRNDNVVAIEDKNDNDMIVHVEKGEKFVVAKTENDEEVAVVYQGVAIWTLGESNENKDEGTAVKGQDEGTSVGHDEKVGNFVVLDRKDDNEVFAPLQGKECANMKASYAREDERTTAIDKDVGDLVRQDEILVAMEAQKDIKSTEEAKYVKDQSLEAIRTKNDDETSLSYLESTRDNTKSLMAKDDEATMTEGNINGELALEIVNVEETVDTLQNNKGGSMEPLVNEDAEVVVVEHGYYSESGGEVEKCRHSTNKGRNDDAIPLALRGYKYEDFEASDDAPSYKQTISKGYNNSKLVVRDEKYGSFEAVKTENDEELTEVSKDENCQCLEALETKDNKKTSTASPVSEGWNMAALVARDDKVVATEDKDGHDITAPAGKVGSFAMAKVENEEDVVAMSQGATSRRLRASDANNNEGAAVKRQDDGTFVRHDEKIESSEVVDANNNNDVFALLQGGECGDSEASNSNDDEGTLATDKDGGDLVRQDEILVPMEAQKDIDSTNEVKYVKDQSSEAIWTKNDEETSLASLESTRDNTKSLMAKDDEATVTEGNVKGKLAMQDENDGRCAAARASSDEDVAAMQQDEKCANLESLDATDDVSTFVRDGDVGEFAWKDEKGGYSVLIKDKIDNNVASACRDAKDQSSTALEIENIEEIVATLQYSEGWNMEPLIDGDEEVPVVEQEVGKYRSSIYEGKNGDDLPPASRGDNYEGSKALNAQDYKQAISGEYNDSKLVVQDEKDGRFEAMEDENNEPTEVSKDEKCPCLEVSDAKDDEEIVAVSPISGGWNVEAPVAGDRELAEKDEKGWYFVSIEDKNDEELADASRDVKDQNSMALETENIKEAIVALQDNEGGNLKPLVDEDDQVAMAEHGYNSESSGEVEKCRGFTYEVKNDNDMPPTSRGGKYEGSETFDARDYKQAISGGYDNSELVVQNEKGGSFEAMESENDNEVVAVLQEDRCLNLQDLDTKDNEEGTVARDQDDGKVARPEKKCESFVALGAKNDEETTEAFQDGKSGSLKALETKNNVEAFAVSMDGRGGNMEALLAKDDVVVAIEGRDDKQWVVQDEKDRSFVVAKAKNDKEVAVVSKDATLSCLAALSSKDDGVSASGGEDDGTLAGDDDTGESFVLVSNNNDKEAAAVWQNKYQENLEDWDNMHSEGFDARGKDDSELVRQDGKGGSSASILSNKCDELTLEGELGMEYTSRAFSNAPGGEAEAKFGGIDEKDAVPEAQDSAVVEIVDVEFGEVMDEEKGGVVMPLTEPKNGEVGAFVVDVGEVDGNLGEREAELAEKDGKCQSLVEVDPNNREQVMLAVARGSDDGKLGEAGLQFGEQDRKVQSLEVLESKNDHGLVMESLVAKNEEDVASEGQDVVDLVVLDEKDESFASMGIKNDEDVAMTSQDQKVGNLGDTSAEDSKGVVAEGTDNYKFAGHDEKEVRFLVVEAKNDDQAPMPFQGEKGESLEASDVKDGEGTAIRGQHYGEFAWQDEKGDEAALEGELGKEDASLSSPDALEDEVVATLRKQEDKDIAREVEEIKVVVVADWQRAQDGLVAKKEEEVFAGDGGTELSGKEEVSAASKDAWLLVGQSDSQSDDIVEASARSTETTLPEVALEAESRCELRDEMELSVEMVLASTDIPEESCKETEMEDKATKPETVNDESLVVRETAQINFVANGDDTSEDADNFDAASREVSQGHVDKFASVSEDEVFNVSTMAEQKFEVEVVTSEVLKDVGERPMDFECVGNVVFAHDRAPQGAVGDDIKEEKKDVAREVVEESNKEQQLVSPLVEKEEKTGGDEVAVAAYHDEKHDGGGNVVDEDYNEFSAERSSARFAILESSEAEKHTMKELGEGSSTASTMPGLRTSRDCTSSRDEQTVLNDSMEGDDDKNNDDGDDHGLDSAALAAHLKEATGTSHDENVIITSQDGSGISSMEHPASLGSSVLPLRPTAPHPPSRSIFFSPSEPAVTVDPTEEMTEEDKKLHDKVELIRVKFLRLVYRMGVNPEEEMPSQVLYRLSLLESIRHGRQTNKVFSLEHARNKAFQLEAEGEEDLSFSCNILVLGKIGVGKSATINSIVGEEKSKTDAFSAGTTKVTEIVGTVDGVHISIIDTPGLQTNVMNQGSNKKILAAVKKHTKKCPPDIVLYVDRLDCQSRDVNDLPLLRTITTTLGSSIWLNTIIALTHAASAPPDSSDGAPMAYEVFVAQRSHIIQQSIQQVAGDVHLMNQVALVENHPSCRRNCDDLMVLSNGQTWRQEILLMCYSSKILSEANSLLKLEDPSPGQRLGFGFRSPQLSLLLSSLLQPRDHPKLSADHGGHEDSDVDLDDYLDMEQDDNEEEYDHLPPFKPLTKARFRSLTKDQKNAYFDEYDYRVKLLQKKKWKDELRLLKETKRGKAEHDAYRGGNMAGESDKHPPPENVAVPLPDMVLPAAFDCDNQTYRYRFLEPTSSIVARPILVLHGWDHDCGYDALSLEDTLAIAEKFPAAISVQVTKDKKHFSIHLDSSISAKHGDNVSSLAGFDIHTIGRQLTYVLHGETKFKNAKKNKTTGGFLVTLGDITAAGVMVEYQTTLGKRLALVASTGAMCAQGDTAYGANLEAHLKDKDCPIGLSLSTFGLSLVKWHGDFAFGANLQSQFSVRRGSKMTLSLGLNNKMSGQISVRASTSEQVQIAIMGLIPLAVSIFKSFCHPEEA